MPKLTEAQAANALRNEDWLRTRSWDIRTPNGNLVETLEQLRAVIKTDDALREFITFPAAEAMPKPLRKKLEEYLKVVAGVGEPAHLTPAAHHYTVRSRGTTELAT